LSVFLYEGLKKLFTDTVSANKNYFTDTVYGNKNYVRDTVKKKAKFKKKYIDANPRVVRGPGTRNVSKASEKEPGQPA
jgi:hypothetical protein